MRQPRIWHRCMDDLVMFCANLCMYIPIHPDGACYALGVAHVGQGWGRVWEGGRARRQQQRQANDTGRRGWVPGNDGGVSLLLLVIGRLPATFEISFKFGASQATRCWTRGTRRLSVEYCLYRTVLYVEYCDRTVYFQDDGLRASF